MRISSLAVLLSLSILCLIQTHAIAATPVAIDVDATLYKKHQVCIADVRGTSGRITSMKLTPSVSDQESLDSLMVHWYWDGSQTPYIVCSLGELLSLMSPDGTLRDMPELAFNDGFRVLIECARGEGAKLKGRVVYEETEPPSSSSRVRFDPGMGITVPQLCDTVRIHGDSPTRLGRGESIELANAGFESGRLGEWHDLSWDSRESKDGFSVFPSGTEGVQAHGGDFMAGIVRGGNSAGMLRVNGLVPGYRYRLSASANTWGLDEAGYVDKSKVRLGINTVGTFLNQIHPEGADPWTTDFSHDRFYFKHCWGARLFMHSQDEWSPISVEQRASGEIACLFLQGSNLLPDTRKWTLFDDIALENVPIPMGTIEGRVNLANGKGVKRALVQVEPWGYAAAVRGGSFRLEDVPEGVYTVTASYEDKQASADGVRVISGQSASVEFIMGDSPSGKIVVQDSEDTGNLLVNGGFESGDTVGWERIYNCDGMKIARSTRFATPQEGDFMFGGEHVYHYAGAREIVYQRVPVEKGARLTFCGRLMAISADDGKKPVVCRLVVDPRGGTDFTIRSENYAGEWGDASITFAAEAETVAVGVAMEQGERLKSGLSEDAGIVAHLPEGGTRMDYNRHYCDDLRLTPAPADAQIAQPSPSPKRPEVAAGQPPKFAQGERVTVTLPDGKTKMDMVAIPAGSFRMGGDSLSGWAQDDEFPRHNVKLGAYYIGAYEVTNAQYKAFCDATGYPYPTDPAFSKIPWAHREERYHYGDYLTGMPSHPVVNVSWHDAAAFCKWAGLRLPTEAEWEMAARGPGDQLTTYPWGEQTDPSWTTRARDNLSIQKPDADLYTCPVDKFETQLRPWNIGISRCGVSGMGGNVREWCADWYGPYSSDDQSDPRGPESGTERVLRGGCWNGRDYGVQSRCSYRWHCDPAYFEWGTTGFRAAADGR